jgi:hypothetical protein
MITLIQGLVAALSLLDFESDSRLVSNSALKEIGKLLLKLLRGSRPTLVYQTISGLPVLSGTRPPLDSAVPFKMLMQLRRDPASTAAVFAVDQGSGKRFFHVRAVSSV